MKKKNLLLLAFSLIWMLACVIAGATPVPPTAAPMLNPPSEQQPVQQNPTAPPVAANPTEASVYREQLNAGTAYDLDNFSVVQDASADFSLDADAWLLQFKNGAVISGYGSTSPYTKGECQSANMSADPLGWQTDLYLCFKTNQGRYGYIVVREATSDAIWFDVTLFP